MIVNVVFLSTSRTGGWVSFTAHFIRGLRAAGHTPRLFKLGRRTEPFQRDYGMGLKYTNTSMAGLEYLAQQRDQPMIVSASWTPFAEQLRTLLEHGAGVVIHDPTEIASRKYATAEAVAACKPERLIIVRRTMQQYLPQARYVDHPYARALLPEWKGPRRHARAFSRVDWDKHTDMIVAANMLLPPELRVRIHGTENRLYTHHKLREVNPEWRRDYAGEFPRTSLWAGAQVARRALWAVDLSVIKGDGGGTQYTFLEALDAGTRLVINKGWLTGDPALDEMTGYAQTVGSATELADLLRADPAAYPLPDAEPLLQRHDAGRAAAAVLKDW